MVWNHFLQFFFFPSARRIKIWVKTYGGGVLVAKLCLTLCDPMYCSLPVSSVHRTSQARILEWVAISFSRGSSWPSNRTQVSCLAGFFTTEPPGKPKDLRAPSPSGVLYSQMTEQRQGTEQCPSCRGSEGTMLSFSCSGFNHKTCSCSKCVKIKNTFTQNRKRFR